MVDAAYLALHRSGELHRRATLAKKALRACRLCGWDCDIDREVELGPCRTGTDFKVASAYRHFGEEAPLVASGGSGAIFFTHCEMRCQFCQTYRWNVQGQGQPLTVEQLAAIMLRLQDEGAENINLVTPTHVAPQILTALVIAADGGLTLPLVWNSAGYDALPLLALLDGVVDIYLVDMKYSDPLLARRLSGIHDYPSINQIAVTEMFRQVGHLALNGAGGAQRGVIVRHLVLPGLPENTAGVLRWLIDTLGPETYLSLMDQYRPAYRAWARPGLERPLSPTEFAEAHQLARSLGFRRIDSSFLTDPVLPHTDSGHD